MSVSSELEMSVSPALVAGFGGGIDGGAEHERWRAASARRDGVVYSVAACGPPGPSRPRRWCDRGALAAEPKLFCHRRAACGIRRRRQCVICREPPADAIGGRFEPVCDPQMPAQGCRAKSAFETHDMVRLHRSTDRHRRHQVLRRQWWALWCRALSVPGYTVAISPPSWEGHRGKPRGGGWTRGAG